jgi:AcrR family transcriptional regulator
MTADSAPRRPRRRPGEAREALVAAARDAFIDAGYQGASLRQIAAKAGTTQAILYRYFPSKAELFKESVLGPFEAFVTALVDGWRATHVSATPTNDLIAGFTESLYDFSLSHRGLIAALLAADAHGGESTGGAKESFRRTIADVVARALEDAVSRGWADIDVEVAVPITMSLIISTALLDDWLFDPAARPDRDRILKEIVRYEIRAITGSEPADGA